MLPFEFLKMKDALKIRDVDSITFFESESKSRLVYTSLSQIVWIRVQYIFPKYEENGNLNHPKVSYFIHFKHELISIDFIHDLFKTTLYIKY